MAAAVAAIARARWGDDPTIVVVEPDAAACLYDSAMAQAFTVASGPVSNMGRLDCKEPSLIAFNGLMRDANAFMTVTDHEAEAAAVKLADVNIASTPSGVAGFAGLCKLLDAPNPAVGLGPTSHVLVIISEGPEA